MQFEATYFDGKISLGHRATLTLLSDSIKIEYDAGDGSMASVYWMPDQIHQNDFYDKTKTVLKYGEFPFQYVEVAAGQEFIDELERMYPEKQVNKSPYKKLQRSGFKGVLIVFFSVVGIFALAYFFVLPFIAESAVHLIPPAQEQKMGNSIYESMASDMTMNDSATLKINEFFGKIKYESEFDIRISVAKEDVINAFALPGGHIVVYDALIKKMDNYSQLAALLSHEYSHVEYRHSTRSLLRSLSGYLFVSVIFGDASGIVAVVAENANTFRNLSYSRSLEKDADMKGLELLKENHIDPNGMVQLFEKLKEDHDESSIPQFMVTHPLTDKRIDYVKEEIANGGFTNENNPEMEVLFNEVKRLVEK